MKTKKIILTTIFLVIASLSKNMYSQIDTCYPHQPTIKPLIKTVFGQHEIPVLVAVGPETSYYWDFIWQYSFDGINYLENSKSINGREALVKMSYLPNVQFGQLIYFRIKYCDGVGFGSSPPVTFMFVSEIPEFSSSLYTANVRCPNEAPQPLLLPFSKPLEGNTTITDVYLYQTVVDGRPTDRVDLNFSSNATGLTIFFDKFLSDGDYFLQMEGKSGETSLNTVSTKVRIRNPQALVFEKIVLPSSGTEYHQGVPEIIADGKVTVSVKNYLNDFSVYWNGSGEKSVETIFSNLVSDVYSTKIIYNSNRCDTTFFTTVGLLNRFLNVRIDEGLPILCYEQSDASLQAVFETATTDMEVVFSWKKNGQVLPNETNCFLENLSAGIYTVIAESEGLQSTFSFEVTEPEESGLFHISIVHPYCFGSDDGHIHVGMIGGTPPYRYVWDNGIVSDFIDQLSAGLYRITVYDYNNCTLSHQVKLNDPPQMVVNRVFIEHPTCSDKADGSAMVEVRGGTGARSWTWNGTPASDFISGLFAGVYHYVVRDANLCELSGNVELIAPLEVTLQLLAHIHCFEHNDAVLEASVKGGVPPYHYRWKHNNDTALRQVDLGVGTYEIEVTDSRNERSFDRIYVSQPEPLRVVLSANSVTGWGASDGSVHAVASGGTPPYTFEWGCSTAASVAGLRAGTYHLQLTDANGCSLENSVVVETPDSLTLVAQIYHCTYFGSIQGVQPVEPDDGRMDCKIDGGVKPYIYQWFYQNSNDEWIELLSKNLPYLDSLTGGRYVLFATDANGYSVSDTFEILKPKPLTASVFAISPVCFGNSDGALQTSVDGGIPPYTYRWNLGDSTALLQNLTVGHYAVVVQDLLGVLSTFEILLTQPEPLSIDFSVNEITNNGLNNGAIFTVVQGGIPPYDYVWINHDTIGYSSQIINIPAGIYDFLVTDDNGCLLSTSFALNNPEAMDISATIKPLSYRGSVQGRVEPQPADGEIFLTVTGGFPPYEYRWSNGVETPYLTNLSEGSYSVVVTDKYGNEAYGSFDIKSMEPLMLTVSQDQFITCFGDFSARLTSHISGGTPPYDFLWSTGTTGVFVDSLPSGNYHLTVIDSLYVVANFTIRIDEPTPLNVAEHVIQPQCPNLTNGAIFLFVSGGVPAYHYHWNTGEQTASLLGMSEGTYDVAVFDANGCRENRSIILQTPLTAHILQHDFIRCFGDSNVTLELVVCGGILPYEIKWNTGDTTLFLHEQKKGLYSVLVTDKKGSIYETSIEIFEPLPLSVSDIIIPPSCFGENDGTIAITAEGGTPPYVYRWSNMTISSQLTNLSGGYYSAFVTDRNGCQITYSTTLVGTLPNDFITEFWHSHEAVVGVDFVVANIGQTPFDSVIWNVIPHAQIVSQNNDYFIIRFADEGEYEIRLIAYKNGCLMEQTGFVQVFSQQDHFHLKSTPVSSLSDLKIFPNPTRDYFNFSVQAPKPTVLYWTLTHVATGSVVRFGKIQTDPDGFATQQILVQKQLFGSYVFRVFSGKEQISSQLIIH